MDSVTHEGEPYATVRVYKGASTKGDADAMSVTDANGNISQKVNGKGRYTIVMSSVGRKTIRRSVSLNGQRTFDLGTMYVEDDEKQLAQLVEDICYGNAARFIGIDKNQ